MTRSSHVGLMQDGMSLFIDLIFVTHLAWLLAWFSCLPCRKWCTIPINILLWGCQVVCVMPMPMTSSENYATSEYSFSHAPLPQHEFRIGHSVTV
jgi:hypothetical protein